MFVWNSLSPSVVDFSSLSAFRKTIHNARLNLYMKYWQHCCIVHMSVAVRPFVYVLLNKKLGIRVYNLLIMYKRCKGWCFCWTVSERSLWYDGTWHLRLIRNFRIFVTFESNSNQDVWFEFEPNLEASQVLNTLVLLSVTSNDLWPGFHGHAIFEVEHRKNGPS